MSTSLQKEVNSYSSHGEKDISKIHLEVSLAHEGKSSRKRGIWNTKNFKGKSLISRIWICCGSALHNESIQTKEKIKRIQWKCFVGFGELCQTLTWNQRFSSLTSWLGITAPGSPEWLFKWMNWKIVLRKEINCGFFLALRKKVLSKYWYNWVHNSKC